MSGTRSAAAPRTEGVAATAGRVGGDREGVLGGRRAGGLYPC